jgi:[acyl-carrier-protein] S-malonyltransferase
MAKRVFLFPGQGAQSVGMAGALCEAFAPARALFNQAADILGCDLLSLCVNGPKDRLDSTVVSQPVIYVASLAALEQLKATEPDIVNECVATAGLSLGEYTALTFAGVLAFEDGLRLVQKRGEAMQAAADAKPGSMVSVLLLEQAKVETIVAEAASLGFVRIANFLCPGNLVVSGDKAACDEVDRRATEAGAKTIRLAVAGAFHTPLMGTAVEVLTQALSSVKLHEMRVPVYANVTAKAYQSLDEIKPTLARQVVEPVLWEASMRNLLEMGADSFCEIGPGKVLAGLLKRINRKIECRNLLA